MGASLLVLKTRTPLVTMSIIIIIIIIILNHRDLEGVLAGAKVLCSIFKKRLLL